MNQYIFLLYFIIIYPHQNIFHNIIQLPNFSLCNAYIYICLANIGIVPLSGVTYVCIFIITLITYIFNNNYIIYIINKKDK